MPEIFDLRTYMLGFEHALFVMINPRYPDKVIHDAVERCLIQQRARLRQQEPTSQSRKGTKDHLALYEIWGYQKLPDLQTWASYFRCFDLREAGRTFGDIAKIVYSQKSQRDRAETAYQRIQRAIRKAELNAWPPRKNRAS